MRDILVVGAGDTGLRLAARLIARGDRITTLNRSGRSVPGATAVRADLADPDSLRGLPRVDVVVSTTAPPSRDDEGYRLAYVDGPARVLAALPAPPTRLVITSTTGVYGVDDGSWVDSATDPVPARRTAGIVLEGEGRGAELAPTVAVRAAGIYGPGRRTRLVDSVRAGETGIAPGAPPRWTNRIHVDDLAAALEVVIHTPDPPPAVIAVDEPCPRDDVVGFIAECLGIAPATEPDPPDRPRGKRCRNDALRGLGWRPAFPTYREGYGALLAGCRWEASTLGGKRSGDR